MKPGAENREWFGGISDFKADFAQYFRGGGSAFVLGIQLAQHVSPHG